jgi:23S rRNA pseudouridine1911/1915/1917 synthase
MDLTIALRPELVHRPPATVSLDESCVLYEDDALIAVDKPPGLPSVATADPARPHLVGLVERLLASRAGAEGKAPTLGVHQRLDRDTSGVVLFVKDPAANAGLGAQFAAHGVEKTYLAVAARPPRLPSGPWRMEDGPEGNPPSAITDFRIVEAWPDAVLVEARPRTGRKHQIRIHLSRAGLPILGDATYGGDRRDAPRVMLHAARLKLRHPLTGEPLAVSSAMPADFQAEVARRRRPEGPSPRRETRRRR